MYSHDCEPHEKVVQKLVDLLSAELPGGTIVDVDFRSAVEIAQNKHDWMYRTAAGADRIVLVHSLGAYMQYHARFAAGATGAKIPTTAVAVERQRPGEFDDLFQYQLDLLGDRMYDGKILHAYFDYTSTQKLLPYAGAAQRYRLPQHLAELVQNLKFATAAAGLDPWAQPAPAAAVAPAPASTEYLANSRQLQELYDAVAAMRAFDARFPNWFEATHVKRPLYSGASGGATPIAIERGLCELIDCGPQPTPLKPTPLKPVSALDLALEKVSTSSTGGSTGGSPTGGSPATPKRKISNGELSTTSASSGIEDAGSSSGAGGGGATAQGALSSALSGSSPSTSERSLNDVENLAATSTQLDSGVYSLRNTGVLSTGSGAHLDEEKVRLIVEDNGFYSGTAEEEKLNQMKFSATGARGGAKKRSKKANRRRADGTGGGGAGAERVHHQSNSNNVLIA